MKNKSIFAQLFTLIKWLMITLLTISIILLMLAMFAGLLSGVSPATVISTLYRYVVPEHFETEQLIETADGKQITVHANKYWYTGKYSLALNTEDYPPWTYENSNIPASDPTYPIIFDVVKDVPWVVLPLRGAKCSEYGFPREGFAVFKLDNKIWKQVSYEQAPSNLRVNMSHVDDYKEKITPEIRQNLYMGLYNSGQMHQYINEDGSGKTIKESAKLNMEYPYIADRDSCHYLNPPVDPDEKHSLREYVEMKAVIVQAKIVKENDEKIELSDNELKQMYLVPKVLGNCDKVVKRHFTTQLAKENQAEFAKVAGIPEGIFKSPGSAERVELNTGTNGETRSFYLPLQGASATRISLMHCQPDRIIVDFGRDNNSLQVLEYNMNAQLQKKWSVQLPMNGHPISDISIDKDRMNIGLVDFVGVDYNQGVKIPGEIIDQYSYEAKLP